MSILYLLLIPALTLLPLCLYLLWLGPDHPLIWQDPQRSDSAK